MKHVIGSLQSDLHTLETNERINRQAGQTVMADLESVVAAETRQALAILRAIEAGPIWPQPTAPTP